MKKLLLQVALFMLFTNCNKAKITEDNHSHSWTNEDRIKHLSNKSDSTTWDQEMLNLDKQFIGIGDFGPFEIGAFPVSNYDLLRQGSFKGLGNKNAIFNSGDRKLLMNCFFVGKNELNKDQLGDLKDQVFFQIITLTDTLDTINYNLNQSIAISRNHPDYMGQGFVKTKHTRIDYLAFQTAENNNYAIVNTRLFDLNFGKTILIAPQKDGSLRSMQMASPQLDSEQINNYTEDLLKQERVMTFW